MVLALDPTLGGLDPKVDTNVRGYKYFIPTKLSKYPSSDSVVKADSVFPYMYMHYCTPLFTSMNI